MKKLEVVVDLDSACLSLLTACDKFIDKNKNSYWANFGLLGKSPVQMVKDLKTELKAQTSIAQLICKVKEYKQDHELVKKFRELVVTQIYQTSDEVIKHLGQDIARQNLVTASRGFSLSVTTNPAPDMDAAMEQLFLEYCKAAKSAIPSVSIELGAK